jgi:hypothetical protein
LYAFDEGSDAAQGNIGGFAFGFIEIVISFEMGGMRSPIREPEGSKKFGGYENFLFSLASL